MSHLPVIADAFLVIVALQVFILAVFSVGYSQDWDFISYCFYVASASLEAWQRVCGLMFHAHTMEGIQIELYKTEAPTEKSTSDFYHCE